MCCKIWGLIPGRIKRFYFLVNVQIGSGTLQLPFHWVPGVLSLGDRVVRACSWPLTSFLVPRLRITGADPSSHCLTSWCEEGQLCLLALLQLRLIQPETFRKYWVVSFIYISRFSGQRLFWLWSCGSWPCVVLLVDTQGGSNMTGIDFF